MLYVKITLIRGDLNMLAASFANQRFTTPGVCSFPNCEVVIVLDDKSRLYACKHILFHVSQFFEKMFLAEFKEKYSKEIPIPHVSKDALLLFLDWADKQPHDPLPSDEASLTALITLADRFMCPRLQSQIFERLNTEDMYKSLSVQSKLNLLQVADAYKGSSVEILEACIRLCSNIPIDQVSVHLTGTIANGTMAALFELIAKLVSDRNSNQGYQKSDGFGRATSGSRGQRARRDCPNCGNNQQNQNYGMGAQGRNTCINCLASSVLIPNIKAESNENFEADFDKIKAIKINRKLLK